jgi:hypothetical protein
MMCQILRRVEKMKHGWLNVGETLLKDRRGVGFYPSGKSWGS